MSKVKGKRVVRRSKRRKTVIAPPASLPPQVPDVDAGASVATQNGTDVAQSGQLATTKQHDPFWKIDKSSKQYEQAQKVLALKAVGMDAASIAESMGISKQTVHNLTYLAGKNGWMTEFANAREQIEYRIMPKVLRELEAGLDDQTRHVTSGMPVAKQIALEIGQGTVFKGFDQAGHNAPSPTNVIGIKIQMVPGVPTEMREGSGGGTPAYVEGEVDDVGER